MKKAKREAKQDGNGREDEEFAQADRGIAHAREKVESDSVNGADHKKAE